jgi:glycosyltransferase involved in cell wall biosynthesis
VAIALLTNFPTPYRVPLFERLAASIDVEVLCYGGGSRYVPAWFASSLNADLDKLPFPARRLTGGPREAYAVTAAYDAVIAPYAGGSLLPAAYLGSRRHHTPFVLWASVWAQPWSLSNAAALPVTRHMYRHAEAVVAYGEHVRRFVAELRGHDDDVFVAPQSVEAQLFGREVDRSEIAAFRAQHTLGSGPLILYVGRLVPEKGVEVMLDAFTQARKAGASRPEPTLVVIGDGPLQGRCTSTPGVRLLGPLPRAELPVAYAASAFSVLASIPTHRFREPWGLVCNEAMHQGRAVIATTAVGAAAGGLVRDGVTGVVVPPGDRRALTGAIETLLADDTLRHRLGRQARIAVAAYNYDAMAAAFEKAVAVAL